MPPSGFTSGLSECSNPPTRFWKGVPMLHRTFFVLPLLFLLLACDAVSAHPSTSAPRTRDLGEYLRACDERHDAIDDWERKHERKIEDEWIDGRRGLLQSGAKLEQVEEEAQSMRRELSDNCEAKKPDPMGRDRPSSRATRDCIDADGMDKMRAEYRENKNRANQKYVGQRICLRGTVSGFSESTSVSYVNATIGDMVGLAQVKFDIGHSKGSAGGREWQAWMMSKSVGDTVEAECMVQQFWPPDIPTFWDCRRMGD